MNTHAQAPPRLDVDESLSLEEQIAHRAYERRQPPGYHSKPGSDLIDWFHAERELTEWHRKRLKTNPTHTERKNKI